MSFHVPNKFRVRAGRAGSDDSAGNRGAFAAKCPITGHEMFIIASDGLGWEHVSASFPHRCPSWAEMCWVKGLFWDESDTVVQFHPAKSEYVNVHPYTLHLWRPTDGEIVTPPSFMV